MTADDAQFSTAAVWSSFYHELRGTLWEGDDLEHVVCRKNHDAMAAALALRHVHTLAQDWKGADPEDGVLATLKAARKHHRKAFLTPGQVKEMAQNFSVFYHDRLEPMEDYLDEHCGEVRWHWLNDHGRSEIEKSVVKADEIWVDETNLSGVWVFRKPGRT